jgi:hypothetical protein
MPLLSRRYVTFSRSLFAVCGVGALLLTACASHERINASAHASTAPAAVPSSVAAPQTASPAAIPAVQPDPRACAASVAEAQATGRYPERLSAQIAPAAYVRTRDRTTQQRYLDVIEPGRVYQTADPATGARQLEALGGAAVQVIPALGTAPLAVRTVPGAPCTFLATEGGAFAETRLACATVLAAADGIARVTYQANAGTIDDASILVGSPETVGTLRLIVHVHYPGSFLPAPAAASVSKP